MWLLDKFFQTNKNETIISEADDLKLKAFLGGKDELTREDVLSIPQVAADVDLITSTFALIPCKLYKHVINEDDKEGVVEIKDDPRVKLLNVETGDTLNAFQFKKAMCEDYFVGKNGGGYAYIKRTRNNVEGLYYVKSEDVSIQGNLQPIFKDYNVWVNGVEYDKTEFLKLLRNSRDGMVGQNITDEVNNALQSAYQMIKFQLQTLKKGGNKKGFLQSQKNLNKESIAALKEAWAALYNDNSSESAAVLNDGVTFKESSNNATELQLNQSKVTLNREIDTLFHISDNSEEFVKRAIQPIGAAFENTLNRDFLLEKEKIGGYFWKMDYSELIKASLKERYESYSVAKQAGFITINEIREMENLESIPGMNVLNVGLGAALYNVDDGTYYVPNTDTARNREDGGGEKGENPDEDS